MTATIATLTRYHSRACRPLIPSIADIVWSSLFLHPSARINLGPKLSAHSLCSTVGSMQQRHRPEKCPKTAATWLCDSPVQVLSPWLAKCYAIDAAMIQAQQLELSLDSKRGSNVLNTELGFESFKFDITVTWALLQRSFNFQVKTAAKCRYVNDCVCYCIIAGICHWHGISQPTRTISNCVSVESLWTSFHLEATSVKWLCSKCSSLGIWAGWTSWCCWFRSALGTGFVICFYALFILRGQLMIGSLS